MLVSEWKQHGPQVRRTIVEVLMSQTTWRLRLLDYIAKGPLHAKDIDATHRHWLLNDNDMTVKHRAQQLFDVPDNGEKRDQLAALRQSVLPWQETNNGKAVFYNKCASCHQIDNGAFRRPRPVGNDPSLTGSTADVHP